MNQEEILFEYIPAIRMFCVNMGLPVMAWLDDGPEASMAHNENKFQQWRHRNTDKNIIYQHIRKGDASFLEQLKQQIETRRPETIRNGLWIILEGMGVCVAGPSHANIQNLRSGEMRMESPEGTGRFVGKVVVVTGAAQGFGKGIAEWLFREGAHLILADLNEEKGNILASDLSNESHSNTAFFVKCNVSDQQSVTDMMAQVIRYFGGLDVLISNAGVLIAGGLEEMSHEDFEFVTKVNYAGFFNCTKVAARIMKSQNIHSGDSFSDIIQINSKSGLQGSHKNFAYAGSKFGSIGLVQSFALELVPYHIKVNAICPGNYFDGPLWSDPDNGLFSQYLKAGKVKGARTIADVRHYYEGKVPMKRGVAIEDIMKAIFYIVDQNYETGQALPVTGGQIMLH